jgi:hypothetical protein
MLISKLCCSCAAIEIESFIICVDLPNRLLDKTLRICVPIPDNQMTFFNREDWGLEFRMENVLR